MAKNDSSVAEADKAKAKKKEEETVTRLGNYTTRRVMVSIADLVAGIFFTVGNWRTEKDYARLAPLRWASLKQIGQETPMWVRVHPEYPDKLEVIRGHTRDKGFLHGVAVEGVAAVEALFPNGIACDVLEGVTEREVALLKQDNANSEDMRDGKVGKLDWTRAGMTMIAAGCSRREIALTLEVKTAKLFPNDVTKGNGKLHKEICDRLETLVTEISELNEQIAKAETEESRALAEQFIRPVVTAKQSEVAVNEKKRDDLIDDIRRGMMDRLANHWNGGPYMDHLLFFATYGERGAECPDSLRLEGMGYAIKGVVTSAAKAARTDAGVDKGFLSAAQRERIPEGTEFQAAWKKERDKADKRKSDKSDSSDDTPRLKAVSAKEMVKEAGTRSSEGYRTILNVLAGKVDGADEEVQEELKEIDSTLEIAGTIRKLDPDFWRTKIVTRYRELREEAKEAAAEAVSEAVPTES